MRLSKHFARSAKAPRRDLISARHRRRRRAIIESLEDRRMLAAFDVITSGDAGIGTCTPAQCTLRDAIIAANDLAGADEIRIAASIVGTITLDPVAGGLRITDPVSILGPGADSLTIRADTSTSEFRVLDVTASGGDVSIDGLNLTGGRVPSDAGGAIRFLSNGTLSITSSTLSGNTAANGGGVYSGASGKIEITDSSISGNTALYGAAGGIQNVNGNITVTSSVVDRNQALNSGGGILNRYGAITITDSQVTDNQVTYPGYQGGGISSGEGNLTITGSTISGNTTAGDGGGIYSYGGVVSIKDSAIRNNDASYSGGAILIETGPLTIDHSTIEDNRALYGGGGGIATDTGEITLTRSVLRGNEAIAEGGAIAIGRGEVTLFSTTLSGNTAGHDGGGIAAFSGSISLENTTISGNTANNDGGGVHSQDATVRIVNSTITRNQAIRAGGGIGMIASNSGESLVLVNTLIAGNTAAADPDFVAPADAALNLQIFHSLVGDNQGTGLAASNVVAGIPQPDSQGNLIGGSPHPVIDPGVAPLALNGGDTETHAPLIESLALDHGRAAFLSPDVFDADGDGDTAEPLPVDQRGAVRVTGVEMDIGAVELSAAANVTWNQPADIALGTALGSVQLNASADVAGTFEYVPPAGTILDVGDGQLLTAVFTPDDLLAFRPTFVSTQINVTANNDFGDAPSRYPVTLADDGARHASGPLRLGSAVDTEPDGQPDEFANGDGADDDGITMLADLVASGLSANTSSLWAVASALGRLDAWIDFNADGDWNDSGEQIVSGITLLPGGNTISFTIPAGAQVGETAARFRLSSSGNLAPTGAASDGEVEDYLLTILDGSIAPDVAVHLPQQRAAVRAAQGRLLVSEGAIDLLGVAQDQVDQLTVIGGASDNTISLDLSQGDPRDQLQLDGMGGSNTLVMIANGATIDFTAAGNTDASHFDRIDVRGSGDQLVTIDAAAISLLSPTTLTVSIAGDQDDTVDFGDLGQWRVIEPQIIDGRFLRTVNHLTGNQTVRLDLPRAWQNPLQPSDVNADGTVTAGDALRIINELARRAYSDSITKNLNDPLTTMPWPGTYYDQNGDGRSTALDALRVINQLARISIGGGEESEHLPGGSRTVDTTPSTDSVSSDHDRIIFRDFVVGRKTEGSIVTSVADRLLPSTNSLDQPGFTDRAESNFAERLVDELLSSQLFLADLFGSHNDI